MSEAIQRGSRRSAVFYFIILVAAAVAVAAISAAILPPWAAGALGVLAGLAVSVGQKIWDDRHPPDFVKTFKQALD